MGNQMVACQDAACEGAKDRAKQCFGPMRRETAPTSRVAAPPPVDCGLDLPSHRRHDSAAAWRSLSIGSAVVANARRRDSHAGGQPMLGRRKSEDGFEWHRYVRTTIKLRREERRRRMLEARRAALQQAGAAGVALVAGSKAAGAAALDGTRAGFGMAGLIAQAVWNILVTAAAIGWHYLAIAVAAARGRLALLLQPLIEALARPRIGGPTAIIGAIALALGIGRSSGAGIDREAAIALALGVLLLIAALPLLSSRTGIRLPRLAVPGISPAGFFAVAAAVSIGVLGWMAL